MRASADRPIPGAGQLADLAEQYEAVGDLAVEFAVTGAVRDLSADVSLAAFRTAQEALTNARKHAPGQPVTLSLAFEPAEVVVRVSNPMPADGTPGELTTTGAGYGLAGLRERAALAGGT